MYIYIYICCLVFVLVISCMTYQCNLPYGTQLASSQRVIRRGRQDWDEINVTGSFEKTCPCTKWAQKPVDYHGKLKKMFFVFNSRDFKVQPAIFGTCCDETMNSYTFDSVSDAIRSLNGGIRDVSGFLLPFAGTVRELRGYIFMVMWLWHDVPSLSNGGLVQAN